MVKIHRWPTGLLSSHPARILSVASGTGGMPVTVPIYNSAGRRKSGQKGAEGDYSVAKKNQYVKPF